MSEADTPDNLYCKLPQDSPISVRGARNYPCMTKPGKRAPTVESATAISPMCRLRRGSMRWGRIRWIRICCRRVCRRMTGLVSSRGLSARWRGRRCRLGRRLLKRRQGRRRRVRSTGRQRRPMPAPCQRRQVRLASTVLASRRRRRAALRPGHWAVRRAGWAVVSAIGFGAGEGGEDVEGHAHYYGMSMVE